MTTEQAEEIMRRAAVKYCPALMFGLRFFGPDNSCEAEPWLTLKPSPVHSPMLRMMTESTKNVLILGFRECGKSRESLLAMAYDGLRLARPTQTIIARKAELADHQLAYLIDHLENNRLLQAEFGLKPGKEQRADNFTVKVGGRYPVTFSSDGITGTRRGYHDTRIVFDDIEDTDDSAYVMMNNYSKIHGTFMGAMQHTSDAAPSQLVFLCNFVGEFCTGKQLWDKDTEQFPEYWDRLKLHALSRHPEGLTDDVADGTSVWPEFRTTEQLHAIRAMMNADEAFSFEREYQNRIVSAADMIWTRGMFERTYSDLPPANQMIYGVYIDTAQNEDESGDRTAITTWGKVLDGPRKGEYPFVDARLAFLAPDQIAAEAVRQYVGDGSAEMPQCKRIVLESKSKRKTGQDPVAYIIEQHAAQENVELFVEQVVPSQGKAARSRAVSILGRTRAISVPEEMSPDMKKCVNQMIQFSGKTERNMSDVDDGHDSCVIALTDLRPLKKGDIDADEWEAPAQTGNRYPAMGARREGY